ncbi:MAG: DNA mismatch repair endonuclease MutL [Clostridiales bacterium]|nr:DNA mismatch repair endonuclease MutL [Clostridiales bacterium]
MAKINILPAKVYNRIAAGEVVDRPYSVVKELVENAIDAGATEIEIFVEQGGKQLIKVIDNGCGIERDDLHSAFLPHATSKIAKAEDLENIVTLGFRGEAVASIAAVSQMTITSKTEQGKCYTLSCNGGEMGEITEAAGQKGTEVCVETLFFNTPVRLGFLKSDRAEETDITNFVSRFILNRPDIAFTYYVNGKKVLQSFGGGTEEAIVSVYGASVLSQCFKIDADKHGIRIRGYIGNQNFSKPNKSYQSIFLNGRYIINGTVSAAISNAYSSYLMKRQYPFYVLYVDVPTEIVDVNVHPNKADVRFADNQIIYGCIYSVISAVLDGHTKAMDYIVEMPNIAQEEPVITFTQEQEPRAEDKPKSSALPSISSTVKEETAKIAPKLPKSLGFATLTYEEAQREIEACAPAFVAKKQGAVPFEEVNQTPEKGFIPMEQIAPYERKTQDTTKPLPRRNPTQDPRKAEAIILKKYPDLFFEPHVLRVDDPAYEKAKKEGVEEDFFAENKRYLEELDNKAKQNKIDVSTCKYAGKLFNTYLLYERKDEVYIIDQHAAHERLIFNRLKEQMQTRSVIQQPMLIPYKLRLNVFESTFIRERLEDIKEMGFEITEDDQTTFSINAIPVELQKIDLGGFFNDILGDISGYRSIKLVDILKDKLASAACKAAVKGGMDLTQGEIDALFALMDGDMGLKCPHGRPVVVKMTRTQLEKMFKRIV